MMDQGGAQSKFWAVDTAWTLNVCKKMVFKSRATFNINFACRF